MGGGRVRCRGLSFARVLVPSSSQSLAARRCCPMGSAGGADEDGVSAFVAFRGELEGIDWESPPARGRRAELLAAGAAVHPSQDKPQHPQVQRAPCLQEEADAFSWDHVDPGPPESDDSWATFEPKDQAGGDSRLLMGGGKKLTKEQRQKLKDAEQLAESRESIRKRGWTEGEVKWRSWLARRGHDVQVNDWNLHKYIDGDCIPPSRDPFWLNANEVPLPDYEAGNDVPNEVGPMEVTTILGERIEPKWKPPRAVVLPPLWHDVDGADLVTRGLGRVCEGYYWRQTIKMVRLEVKVPEGTSARDLRVTIEPTRIAIAAARADGGGVLFDEELFMKIYVGSNADEETSIWELQDKRVVVFHLVKWHRLAAGNVRDSSRTWWPRCLVREEESPLTNPHGDYYNEKDDR